jgi:hypothetical protein
MRPPQLTPTLHTQRLTTGFIFCGAELLRFWFLEKQVDAMASDDTKDDKEALKALESEAYEFDKVNK